MNIITLASQKGGVSKSSLAIACAVLAGKAARSLIIDADRQGTALAWRKGRDGAGPEVRPAAAAGDLERTLDAAHGYDYVFIDTAGRDEPGEAFAIRASNLTLIPCRPTMADLRAVPATAQVARRLKRPFAFVLTQVPTTRGTRADETAAALAELGEVAPIRISHRIVWQDAYAAGCGVSEYEPDGPAARELAALWRWLNARLKGLNDA